MPIVPGAWGAAYLPLFVMANIVVTVVVGLFLRTFAAGRWTAQQDQQSDRVTKIGDRVAEEHRGVEELNIKMSKLQLDMAVLTERIKHLERGGAGRNAAS